MDVNYYYHPKHKLCGTRYHSGCSPPKRQLTHDNWQDLWHDTTDTQCLHRYHSQSPSETELGADELSVVEVIRFGLQLHWKNWSLLVRHAPSPSVLWTEFA